MPKNLPIELLRCFVTVVDAKSFSRAAESLSLSQPAVSLQIKRLEDLLGQTLLNRGTRELLPSRAGEEMLSWARRIVRLNDDAVASMMTPGLSGHLRLGVPNEFAVSYLPKILGQFSRRYPNLTLEVTCDLSTHLLTRLEHHELDLCIAVHRDPVDSSLDSWTEDLCWVTSANLTLDPQQAIPLVVAPTGCVYRDRMVNTLRSKRIESRIVYTGTSYNGIRAAVASGLGITALARSTVPPDLEIASASAILPDLKPAFIAIHYDQVETGDETTLLVDYIREAFLK